MGEGSEQRLIEQLVAQAAVEALDKAVLLRLAGRDVVPADARLIRPLQDGVRGVLRAVVADDRVWSQLSLADDGIQFPRDPAPGKGAVRHERQSLASDQVQSSTTARMRNRRPSVSWSETKSRLQRWLGACGVSIGRRVPMARLRPPRRRTVSRSSR